MADIMLPGKGFSLTAAGDKLIAATSTRHLLVYDVRRCSTVLILQASLLILAKFGSPGAHLAWH